MSSLVNLLGEHASNGTGALVISALLDFFICALCEPYSQTTDAEHFSMLMVRRRRPRQPARCGAVCLMRGLSCGGVAALSLPRT